MDLDSLDEEAEFECCICQEVLPDAKALADHLSRHGEEDPEEEKIELKTDLGKPTVTLDEYLNGKEVPDSELDYLWISSDKTCPLCLKKSRSPTLLKGHYERHYNVLFRCQCQKTFSSTKSLLTHLSSHTGPAQYQKAFLCIPCASSFNTIDDLKAHLVESEACGAVQSEANSIDEDEKEAEEEKLTIDNFICALCQKDFNNWDTMNFHVEGHYNPKYTCFCSNIFYSEDSFRDHSVIHENSDYVKTFNCAACKSDFSTIENMEKHLKLPFNVNCLTFWKSSLTKKCEFCPKKNVTDSHTDSHFDVRYLCSCSLSLPPNKYKEHCRIEKCTSTKYYTCPCETMFPSVETLKQHFEANKQCKSEWESNDLFLGKSIPDKLLACSLCKKGFVCKAVLTEHIETHYNAIYKCECSESFTLDEFNIHCVRNHNKLRYNMEYDKVLLCECGSQFNFLEEMEDHLKSSDCSVNKVQPNELLFPCPLCPKVLTTKTSLRCHHDKHYNVLFVCECGKDFKLFKGFETHCTTVHNQTPSRVKHVKSFVCFLCGCSFGSIENLGRHFNDHDSCFDRFENELIMFTRKSFIEHKKRFECHICKKSFHQKAQLRDHIESHFLVKYACRRCSKVLTSKSNFRVHSGRTHNSSMKNVGYDKKFACSFCPKEFNSLDAIDKHSTLHEKNGDSVRRQKAEFKCKDCQSTFKTSRSLMHHKAYFSCLPIKCSDKWRRVQQRMKTNGPIFIDVESPLSIDKEVMLTSEVTIQPRPKPTDTDPLCS